MTTEQKLLYQQLGYVCPDLREWAQNKFLEGNTAEDVIELLRHAIRFTARD
jgi:hypothetical protein